MAAAAVELQQVRFSWSGKHTDLSIEHFSVGQGERVFIQGPSGSGKSTLLNLLAGIIRPGHGEVSLMGNALNQLSSSALDRFRADHCGFIFQQFNLLPYLNLIDNVLLPCRFSQLRRSRAEQVYGSAQAGAISLLQTLGLDTETLSGRGVRQLSTGQQQRVAVARALLGMPELIIADEPTSALDAGHRDRFMHLLCQEAERQGSTLLFVSHDPALQAHFDRVEGLKPAPQGGSTL
ncbi:ABC transporter ATP-binding protein [Neptuniibacter halophilus]|uniref:ABC transporter ATP-binding protein n=1 Tax=Neptuniibacter halophilus TaxID=651666 RepID=UPI002572CE48|nr:ABC transporter ATP-binding protein [Neptuniibacter halophilus]